MDPEFIRTVEVECKRAIAKVVHRHFGDMPPKIPVLMAKAAIAVLEAVVEEKHE